MLEAAIRRWTNYSDKWMQLVNKKFKHLYNFFILGEEMEVWGRVTDAMKSPLSTLDKERKRRDYLQEGTPLLKEAEVT